MVRSARARAPRTGWRLTGAPLPGHPLNAHVAGSIVIKSYLSGMPECKFGLNDKVALDRESKEKANRHVVAAPVRVRGRAGRPAGHAPC